MPAAFWFLVLLHTYLWDVIPSAASHCRILLEEVKKKRCRGQEDKLVVDCRDLVPMMMVGALLLLFCGSFEGHIFHMYNFARCSAHSASRVGCRCEQKAHKISSLAFLRRRQHERREENPSHNVRRNIICNDVSMVE